MAREMIDLSEAPLTEEERSIVDSIAIRQYLTLLPTASGLADHGFPPIPTDDSEGEEPAASSTDDDDEDGEDDNGYIDGDDWKPKKKKTFHPFVLLAESSMNAAMTFVYIRRGFVGSQLLRRPQVVFEREASQPPPCGGGHPENGGGAAGP